MTQPFLCEQQDVVAKLIPASQGYKSNQHTLLIEGQLLGSFNSFAAQPGLGLLECSCSCLRKDDRFFLLCIFLTQRWAHVACHTVKLVLKRAWFMSLNTRLTACGISRVFPQVISTACKFSLPGAARAPSSLHIFASNFPSLHVKASHAPYGSQPNRQLSFHCQPHINTSFV